MAKAILVWLIINELLIVGMKIKYLITLTCVWVMSFPFISKAQIEMNFRNTTLVIEGDSCKIQIACLNAQTIHVQIYPTEGKACNSLVVDDAQFLYKAGKVKETQTQKQLITPLLTVSYDKSTGFLSFIDTRNEHTILRAGRWSLLPVNILGEQACQLEQTFLLSADEAIYGLGQYQDGSLNFRGKKVDLVHANREIAVPVLVSTSNYLIYWDNYSKTTFKEANNKAVFCSEMGDGISYYLIYGESMKQTMACYRDLTGGVPMLPKSSFGLWVSRERYKTFDELEKVVAEYRKRKIPLDNIVQDWQYWGKSYGSWNGMIFDSISHPHPRETINRLHRDYHVKFALSVWPGVGKDTEIYRKMDSAKVLFEAPTWAGYKVVDIYNPKAQEIYWDFLYRGLYSKGVDTWWMDATEPSFTGGLYQKTQEEAMKNAGMTYWGPFHRYLNTYSLVLSKIMYENLRKVNNKRVSILTRSAFAGQQRYSTITWSGDIYASWDVLKKQIPAGLSLCMTGLPYWTTDIGGFRVCSRESVGGGGAGELDGNFTVEQNNEDGGYIKGLEDPAYLELYTRWFQYGAFNPIFRIHGTEVPREIWYFGKPGTPFYDAQLDMIQIRYRLLSYIYSTAWKVTNQGETLMKALVLDFPEDRNVWNKADSYMFGDALLVHPVTIPMYYNREGKITELHTEIPVYLPIHKGSFWYDFNSDQVYHGGKTIGYSAPLEVLPLFVKAGSILPINSPSEFAVENDNREMEIRIYAGDDADFVLYEDDNETYDYENGDYSILKLFWNEKKRMLSLSGVIGKRKMDLEERIFNVKLIEVNDRGFVVSKIKRIIYKGKKQEIFF